MISAFFSDLSYLDLAKVPEKFRRCDMTERLIRGFSGPCLQEATALPDEMPEIKWQETNQQDFYVVDEVLVSNHVSEVGAISISADGEVTEGSKFVSLLMAARNADPLRPPGPRSLH